MRLLSPARSLSTLVVALLAACGGSSPANGTGGASSSSTGALTTSGATSSGATSVASSGATGGSTSTSTTGGTGGTTAASSGTGVPMPSPGCGMPAMEGSVNRHVMINGIDRTFTEVIPAGYDPNVAHSLIVRFHGLGGTGAGAVGGIGLTVPPIMVGPDANPPGGAWDTSGDLAFVDAILSTLSQELCIDQGRNFATGYSNGGFMADAVGCKRSQAFRGIAIMEGGSSGGGCGQTGVFIMHNQDDMTVPLSYGTTLRDGWLATNMCAMTSQPVMPDPCVAYDGCSAGHPVIWCSPATGGHKPNYNVALGIGAFFDKL